MFEEFVLPGTWRVTVGSLAFAIVMSILVFVTIRRALIRVYGLAGKTFAINKSIFKSNLHTYTNFRHRLHD